MKKGEISIQQIVVAIIALVVLLVVFSSTGILFGREINIFKLLPNFGADNKTVENVEIFRYDISNGNVMYYDGTSWSEFSGEIRAGDKKVNYSELKKNFENQYYGKRENDIMEIEQGLFLISVLTSVNSHNNNIIEIDKNLEDTSKFLGALNLKIYEVYTLEEIASGYNKDLGFSFEKAGSFRCEKCKIGDMRFQLMNRDMSRGSPISFVLNLDDSVGLYYSDEEQFSKIVIKGDLLTRIFNHMKNWRDGVLKKPIGVNYMLDDSGVYQYFCGELRDKRYIIIDLSKGVDSDAKC